VTDIVVGQVWRHRRDATCEWKICGIGLGRLTDDPDNVWYRTRLYDQNRNEYTAWSEVLGWISRTGLAAWYLVYDPGDP
jgi:hypothetical protein